MTRPLFSDLSTPPLAGTTFLAQDNAVKNLLLDGATAPLTDVATDGGDENALTANVRDFYVDTDFIAGQAIRFVYPAAANTGGMTIVIQPVDDAGDPVGSALTKNLLTAKGDALAADQLLAGLVVEAVYEDGAFQITSSIFGISEASRFHFEFIASGTWTKPLGLSAQAPVHILCRAAGGGGSSSNNANGGGGGGAALRIMTLGDLSATESVVVGAGGAAGVAGGNSSFGAHVTAYGGQTGQGNVGAPGGGMFAIGGAPTDTAVTNEDARSPLDGGRGGANAASINPGRGLWGGGGGGGGSAPGGTGAASLYSGNGGNANAAGVAPSGGGGGLAAGARGQVDIWI